MLTENLVFIIVTDNINVKFDDCTTGIESVWTNEKKAQKHCDKLNLKWGDEVYFVEPYKISK